MVCCNVLVINTPIGRKAAHDDRYMQRAANEGIAALQRQQQVVVIALHRRFMSLGGGNFPPQVATTCDIQNGNVTPGCGDVEARTCRGWGRLHDDSGTNRPLRFETCIIVTNAINRVVNGDKSHSDNHFSLTKAHRQISLGNSAKPCDVVRIQIACLAGTSAPLRSHAAQAI
jgi:hypothetical protein